MAQATFLYEGSTLDFIPVADVAAGDVVVQGDLIGVAKTSIAANVLGALAIEGVFDFAKEAGGGVTFTVGSIAYWDDTNNVAVASDGGGTNKRLGKVIAAAADTYTSVRVRLD